MQNAWMTTLPQENTPCMYNAELHSKLVHLTLTETDGSIEFIGTFKQWQDAAALEKKLYANK